MEEEEEDRWAYIYVPSCAAIRTQEIGVLCDVTMNGGVYGGGGGGAAFQISESEVIAPRGDLLCNITTRWLDVRVHWVRGAGKNKHQRLRMVSHLPKKTAAAAGGNEVMPATRARVLWRA